MLYRLRTLVGQATLARPWARGHGRLLRDQVVDRSRPLRQALPDETYLRAAAEWLGRAQDASGDGGVSGRYLLATGWTSSYPETTGYIVPTFLALADRLDPSYRQRAERAVAFLQGVQLASGAFPGGEIAENQDSPSVFNSAQIITGLLAWYRASGDTTALESANRAGEWLVSVQDGDGAWRSHVYLDVAAAYHAHASCWLAELGAATGNGAFLASAERNLDWLLSLRDPSTGWFRLTGFSSDDHSRGIAVTHAIAYTIWGTLLLSDILERPDGTEAARRAAWRVGRRLELSRWLPGMLDGHWRGASSYACLTGNAQMALIWFRLHRHEPDLRFVNAAFKAIDLVKRAQPLENPAPGIQGGVPGSDPIWGGYLTHGLPNWATKFYIDALLEKEKVLESVQDREPDPWLPSDQVPSSLPTPQVRNSGHTRVVLYAGPGSLKVGQLLERGRRWGFRPVAVVVESPPAPGFVARLMAAVRDRGFGALVAALHRRFPRSAATPSPTDDRETLESICQRENIAVLRVNSLEDQSAIDAVRSLQPDLAVHAGAGTLRKGILEVPRLGTINAHMGVLPKYRGMNVTEWARIDRGPVGCTVHLIDLGIDTGPMLYRRVLEPNQSIRDIGTLRSRVDELQMDMLDEVIASVCRTGQLPEQHEQAPEDGQQYFRMHRELAGVLTTELEQSASRSDKD